MGSKTFDTIHCQDWSNWSVEEISTCRFNVFHFCGDSLFPGDHHRNYHQITMTYNYYIATYNHLNCLTSWTPPTQCTDPTWVTWNRPDHFLFPQDFHLRLLLRVIQLRRRLLSSPIRRWRRSIGVHWDSWPPTHDIQVRRSLVYHNFHFKNRYRARPIHCWFASSENLLFYVLRVKVENGIASAKLQTATWLQSFAINFIVIEWVCIF